MSYITLENFYHLALVFRRIFVEVFYERNEVGVRCISDFLILDELKDVVVALKLFFTTINRGFSSLVILFIRLVIDSRIGEIGCGIFFF